MKPDELISHFGSVKKAALGVGVSLGAVYQWIEAGEIPPMRQSDIEVRTGYKLLSDFTAQRHRDEHDDTGRKRGTG